MSSRYIAEDVRKRLYAESLGRCMNPACQKKLFSGNGDIIEKPARINVNLLMVLNEKRRQSPLSQLKESDLQLSSQDSCQVC